MVSSREPGQRESKTRAVTLHLCGDVQVRPSTWFSARPGLVGLCDGGRVALEGSLARAGRFVKRKGHVETKARARLNGGPCLAQ
jgi:hypothetical protein